MLTLVYGAISQAAVYAHEIHLLLYPAPKSQSQKGVKLSYQWRWGVRKLCPPLDGHMWGAVWLLLSKVKRSPPTPILEWQLWDSDTGMRAHVANVFRLYGKRLEKHCMGFYLFFHTKTSSNLFISFSHGLLEVPSYKKVLWALCGISEFEADYLPFSGERENAELHTLGALCTSTPRYTQQGGPKQCSLRASGNKSRLMVHPLCSL